MLVLLCLGIPGAGAEALGVDAMCSLVRHGTVEQIEAAIRDGGDIRGTNGCQRTVLIESVMWGTDPDKIRALLKAGADPNGVGWSGRTALHWTGWSRACKAATVPILKDAGADVRTLDNAGKNALHAVIGDADRPDIVTALITAGVDVQQADAEGWTPLDRARERNRTAIIDVLLKAGAKAGTTSMWAILKTGSPAAVRELITSTRIDLNARDQQTHTIPFIEVIATVSDPAVLAVMLEHGADIRATDAWGNTPLLRAAEASFSPQIVAALIRAGAPVDAHRNGGGETALMLAISHNENRLTVVEALLQAHADIQAKDTKGRTALDYATENPHGTGMSEVQNRLRAAGAQEGGSLWHIVEIGSVSDVAAAIASGADVNARDENGCTVLMWAIMFAKEQEIVSELLRAGADPDAADRSGRTARTVARDKHDPAIISLFDVPAAQAVPANDIEPPRRTPDF